QVGIVNIRIGCEVTYLPRPSRAHDLIDAAQIVAGPRLDDDVRPRILTREGYKIVEDPDETRLAHEAGAYHAQDRCVNHDSRIAPRDPEASAQARLVRRSADEWIEPRVPADSDRACIVAVLEEEPLVNLAPDRKSGG